MEANITRLLEPGTTPPDFAFHADGISTRLSNLAWRFRVMLVFCPEQAANVCAAGIQNARARWRDFEARDTVLIVVHRLRKDQAANLPDAGSPVLALITDEHGDLTTEYSAQDSSRTVVYLIGKDGTVKAAWTHWPANDELFRAIDVMPMRQQEVRIRQQASR